MAAGVIGQVALGSRSQVATIPPRTALRKQAKIERFIRLQQKGIRGI
jgi:hypothetical protein